MLVPNIMHAFENKRVQKFACEHGLCRAHGPSHARGDLHAILRANVGRIVTVFPDEGIFVSALYFFILLFEQNDTFLDGFKTFFLKSRVAALQ